MQKFQKVESLCDEINCDDYNNDDDDNDDVTCVDVTVQRLHLHPGPQPVHLPDRHVRTDDHQASLPGRARRLVQDHAEGDVRPTVPHHDDRGRFVSSLARHLRRHQVLLVHALQGKKVGIVIRTQRAQGSHIFRETSLPLIEHLTSSVGQVV